MIHNLRAGRVPNVPIIGQQDISPELRQYPRQLEAYKRMPDSVLFRVQKVRVDMSEYDLPGPTRKKVSCSRCGQVVRDNREVVQNGHILCKPCVQGAYFSEAEEITWPNMNWTPVQKEEQMFVATKAPQYDLPDLRGRQRHEEK